MKFNHTLLFLLIFFIFSRLGASSVTETLGATSTVNPFSARMFAGEAEAVYFNPALLPKTKRSLTLNFFYSYQNLDITLFDRNPDSLDVIGNVNDNTGIYGTMDDLPYKPQPTSDLKERGRDSSKDGNLYGALGLVLPIWKDYIALGFYGMIPVGSLMKEQSFFADEREANFSNSLHYELYDDRMTSFNISLALGGGYKWVYAGAGLNITAEALVKAPIYTPDAGKNENKIGTFAEIKPKLVPHFGLIIRPWGPIQVGFTAHLPAKTDIDVDASINFWNVNSETESEINNYKTHIAYAFRPLALSPSIALVDWKFRNELELSVGFTAIWRQWSKYRNRYNESPEYNVYWDSTIQTKDENGNVKVGGWASEYVEKYKWKDSWEFTLGSNFKYHAIKTGLDLGYFISPVPKQDGRTNYVDNDRLSIAAGFSYTWELPEKTQLEAGVNFQAHIMLERTTEKLEGDVNSVGKDGKTVDEFPDSVCDGFDPNCAAGTPIKESEGFQTNNPGYPGYKSSGQIFAGGLWLTLYF